MVPSTLNILRFWSNPLPWEAPAPPSVGGTPRHADTKSRQDGTRRETEAQPGHPVVLPAHEHGAGDARWYRGSLQTTSDWDFQRRCWDLDTPSRTQVWVLVFQLGHVWCEPLLDRGWLPSCSQQHHLRLVSHVMKDRGALSRTGEKRAAPTSTKA